MQLLNVDQSIVRHTSNKGETLKKELEIIISKDGSTFKSLQVASQKISKKNKNKKKEEGEGALYSVIFEHIQP